MSYISTIGALDSAAVSAPSVTRPGAIRVARPVRGVAEAAGEILAASVEGAVFLTVMVGLSLTFCLLVAGVA